MRTGSSSGASRGGAGSERSDGQHVRLLLQAREQWCEVDRLGADDDLDRLDERVQETPKRFDQRRLLFLAAKGEASAARAQQQGEAAALALDKPRVQNRADGQVERCQLSLRRQ